MSKLNDDGLEPGSNVDFKTMIRVNSARKNKKPAVKKGKKTTVKVQDNVTK